MTDTEILTQLCANMRSYWVTGVPLPPARIKQWAVWVDERRKEQPGCRRESTTWKTEYYQDPNTPFQDFWRCGHYPEAIHNWAAQDVCEHGCDKIELRWYDHGVNKVAAKADVPRETFSDGTVSHLTASKLNELRLAQDECKRPTA